MRTKQLDYDARRNPKSGVYCVRCQKDLKPNQRRRMIHLIDGGMTILHPEDEPLYKPDAGDLLWHPVGIDCARQIGLEWSAE